MTACYWVGTTIISTGFQKAIRIDPAYAEAYEFLSHCHVTAYVFGWPGFDETLDAAVELAEKSVQVKTDFSAGYARLGWIQGYLREFDAAVENFEHAITISPRSAPVLYTYGETMNKAAAPKRALPLLESAYSIDPFVPPSWDFARGHSFILMRRFSEALAQFTSVVHRAPKFLPAHVQLARTHAEMGNADEARDVIRSIVKDHGNFNLDQAARMFPYPAQVEEDRLIKSLAAYGLA